MAAGKSSTTAGRASAAARLGLTRGEFCQRRAGSAACPVTAEPLSRRRVTESARSPVCKSGFRLIVRRAELPCAHVLGVRAIGLVSEADGAQAEAAPETGVVMR
jgi:hypothetical protein